MSVISNEDRVFQAIAIVCDCVELLSSPNVLEFSEVVVIPQFEAEFQGRSYPRVEARVS